MTDPTIEEMLRHTLTAWDAALSAQLRNGAALPAGPARTLARLALGDPVTAARLPNVLRYLPPDVAAAVRRLAADGVTQPVTQVDGPGDAGALSGRYLSAGETAAAWGISPAGVRARCRRGRITGAYRDSHGQWQVPEGAAGGRGHEPA